MGTRLDLCMRIHWLGVTVDWEKVEGKEKLHSLHDDVCITGSLVYHGIICFFSRGICQFPVFHFMGGSIVILDGAELETGLRT